jgi:hypothetical protein
MAVEAFIALKESVAVFAKFPFNEEQVLCITQLAQIATRMAGDFIESFLALMTVLFTGEEGRHTGDDVVMVVMMVQV